MKCYRCEAELIWGGDHTYEDYGLEEEEGVVTNLSCPDCNAEVIVYAPEQSSDTPTPTVDVKNEKR